MKLDRMNKTKRSCEGCGIVGMQMDLHHKTYERLGCELDSDVMLLCKRCHYIQDLKREEEGRKRSKAALQSAIYESGLWTYMGKKYGEDWIFRFSYEDAEYEYDLWLEKKESYEY